MNTVARGPRVVCNRGARDRKAVLISSRFEPRTILCLWRERKGRKVERERIVEKRAK